MVQNSAKKRRSTFVRHTITFLRTSSENFKAKIFCWVSHQLFRKFALNFPRFFTNSTQMSKYSRDIIFIISENPSAKAKLRYNFRRLIYYLVLAFPRVSAIFKIFLSLTSTFWKDFYDFSKNWRQILKDFLVEKCLKSLKRSIKLFYSHQKWILRETYL